jgi:adenylate cyclase
MKQNVRFPISFKLALIFSILVLLVLGASTYMVSTLVRGDERIKAEENNHTINGRTAESVQSLILFIQNDAVGFLNTLPLLVSDERQSSEETLFDDFCVRTRETMFLTGPGFTLHCSPALTDLHPDAAHIISVWLDSQNTLCKSVAEGVPEIVNISSLFNKPALCILFPYKAAAGWAAVGFSADRLLELLSTGSYNTSFVINRDGDILIHPDYTKTIAGGSLASLPAVQLMKVSTIDNGQSIGSDESGVSSFFAFHRIAGGMYVVTSEAQKVVFEAIDRTTYRIILFSLAVLFLAVLVIRLFSRGITHPIRMLVDASHQIEEGNFVLDIKARTRDELGLLTVSFVQMGRGLAERERLKIMFSKFTNRTIAERALRGELELGGTTKTATIFFSDIRSFTAMSEKLQPQEVVAFLNDYMTRMVACVNRTGGVVDKYMGDSIMAVWGTPESAGTPEADAWNSVKTALMMRTALYEFNKNRGSEKNPVIRIGCGINTGSIVAGQIGSADRMEYTVIGDAVNFASRTESLNKLFATDILITENTWILVKDHIIVTEMPSVRVKGKSEPVRIFAVINAAHVKGPKTLDELRQLLHVSAPDLTSVDTNEEEKKYSISV